MKNGEENVGKHIWNCSINTRVDETDGDFIRIKKIYEKGNNY